MSLERARVVRIVSSSGIRLKMMGASVSWMIRPLPMQAVSEAAAWSSSVSSSSCPQGWCQLRAHGLARTYREGAGRPAGGHVIMRQHTQERERTRPGAREQRMPVPGRRGFG